MPVGQYPTFDMNAIDDVVVRRRLVCMAVDEGDVAMVAQEIVGGGGLQVAVGIGLALLAGVAAPDSGGY